MQLRHLFVALAILLCSCSGTQPLDSSEDLLAFNTPKLLQKYLDTTIQPQFSQSDVTTVQVSEGDSNSAPAQADDADPEDADIYQLHPEQSIIYQATGDSIQVLDVSAEAAVLLTSFLIEAEDTQMVDIEEMHLYENTLVAISRVTVQPPPPTEALSVEFVPESFVMLYLIDVTDAKKPNLQRSIRTSGTFVDSKRFGSHLYMVNRYYMGGVGSAKLPNIVQAAQVDGSVLEIEATQTFAPRVLLEHLNGKERDDLLAPRWMTLFLTLDLSQSSSVASYRGIMGNAQSLAVSPDFIVVATESVIHDIETFGALKTALHAFQILQTNKQPLYIASGRVEGRVINRYSVDEWDGAIRVATRGDANRLTILRPHSGKLQQVAMLDNLAPGEQITGNLFEAARGFIVTAVVFQDPLFTLDLADPMNPLIMGELKVPGRTQFLKSYGEDHLVAVGIDDFNTTTLALYDISDFAQPIEVDRQEVQGWSEANQDDRALSIVGNIVSLPSYNSLESGPGSMMSVYNIDTAQGLIPLAELSFDNQMGQFRRALAANDQYMVLLDGGAAGFTMDLQELWKVQYN